ncbi:MFS transporter [Rugosimonospora acidiphila]
MSDTRAPWSRPGAPAPARPARALALLGTAQVTLIFTITMIGVPLPAIGRQFGVGRPELVLLSAAYGLSFSGLLLFGGRLSTRYGGRPTLTAGLAVFAAASVASAVAPGFGALALARFTQGIGAALIAPAAMVLLREVFPGPGRYRRAMATWGGLSVLGATAGVVLSGAVTALGSWRLVFGVPVLVAGLALPLVPRLLPAGRPGTRTPLDLPGAALATGGITLLDLGLVMAGDRAWSSPAVAAPLGCGLAALAGFLAVEARGRDPLLPPAFLADRRRAAALMVAGLSAAATTVACLFLPLYLQQIRGWSAPRTSLAFVPYAVALIAAGRAAGRLVERLRAPAVILVGLTFAACGLFLLAPLDPHTPYPTGLLPGLLLLPVGVALTFSASAVLATAGVPPAQTGLAGGVFNTAIELGPTAGVAVASALAAARTGHVAPAMSPAGATSDGYGWSFGATGLALALLATLIAVAVLPRRHTSVTTPETEGDRP